MLKKETVSGDFRNTILILRNQAVIHSNLKTNYFVYKCNCIRKKTNM